MDPNLRCAGCARPLNDDEIVVTATGATLHLRCWRGGISYRRSAGTGKRSPKRKSGTGKPGPGAAGLADSAPLCPACLQPIELSDVVAGRRDDLMHERCNDAPR
jgi:hypothetical protein